MYLFVLQYYHFLSSSRRVKRLRNLYNILLPIHEVATTPGKHEKPDK